MDKFLRDEIYRHKDLLFTVKVTKSKRSRIKFQAIILESDCEMYPVGFEGIHWWRKDFEKIADKPVRVKPVKTTSSEPYYFKIPKPKPELGKIQIATMMTTTEFLTKVSSDKMDFIEFLKSEEFEKKFKENFAILKSW
jgi:hypothetical protein